MTTTLVTGASGFIGSAVVRRLLARGRRVRCLVVPGESRANLEGLNVEIVLGDVLDRESLARAIDGCGVVYHLAALYKLWLAEPRRIFDVNVSGTRNVLSAAGRAGVDRVVYTSSIAAVGFRDGALADEDTEFNQWSEANDYIRSKWLAEQAALGFAAEGLPVVIVNPSFPFGPGDRVPTPTGRTIVELIRGRLPVYVRGGINVVDVDDCAEAHLAAEERGQVGRRYILGSHNVRHRDFVHEVARVAGVRPPIMAVPKSVLAGAAWFIERVAAVRKAEPAYTYKAVRFASRELWFDVSRATTELGMSHASLSSTIERSVRWFNDNAYV